MFSHGYYLHKVARVSCLMACILILSGNQGFFFINIKQKGRQCIFINENYLSPAFTDIYAGKPNYVDAEAPKAINVLLNLFNPWP